MLPRALVSTLVLGLATAAAAHDLDPARLVDLTHPFDARTVYWPTARPFTLEPVAHGMTEGGYWYAANDFIRKVVIPRGLWRGIYDCRTTRWIPGQRPPGMTSMNRVSIHRRVGKRRQRLRSRYVLRQNAAQGFQQRPLPRGQRPHFFQNELKRFFYGDHALRTSTAAYL